MKILLLGKNGQVGRALAAKLPALGEVVAPDKASSTLCGDLANLHGLARTVQTVRPQVIVNAAAYTDVDRAEAEPALARCINALAPQVLAQEAARLGAWLVHYSSDYVFDGTGTTPWQETDTPAPLNVYGRTKLEGERAIAALCPRHLVLRTSWVHSPQGSHFLRRVLTLAQEQQTLHISSTQHGAPTSADWLAGLTTSAIAHLQVHPGHAGLYHAVCSGETSRLAYAKHLVASVKHSSLATKIIANAFLPATAQALLGATVRPDNSRLNTDKLRRTFGTAPPPWQNEVDRTLQQLLLQGTWA